jgi:hypothetical protein
MIVLGGLSFEVAPWELLSTAERRAIASLTSRTGDALPAAGRDRPFTLEIEEGPPPAWPGTDLAPASVEWDVDRVRVRHRRLDAVLDPASHRGRLRRDASVGWPLEVTLRTALAARLPLAGGLPLHAAGLVVEGHGVAFFGPSGAGKSTLAATSPHAVLSDEMVTLVPLGETDARPRSYGLSGTGFWGAIGQRPAPAGSHPLSALVELAHGPHIGIDHLDARTATRRLIASVLVPPGPPLWSAVLSVIGDVVRSVPVLRLAWNPDELPWAALARALPVR